MSAADTRSTKDLTQTRGARAGAAEIWHEREGTRLFAVASGGADARPLVFIHGGLADHRAAALYVGGLEERYRVITPDLRGSGRSRFRGALTWDALADDVAGLLDHLGVERAVVGGVSFGSGVALRLALRHPRRVAGLALLSPLFAGAERGLAPAPREAMLRMADFGERALREGIAALTPLFAELPPAIRARALAMVASFDPGSVAATTRFLASEAQPIASLGELATITAPTLVVPGEDPSHPAEVAAAYAEHLRDVEVAGPGSASAALLDAFARRLRG
ncbi:MAG: alpha/beta hydrolase [Nannocystaceae bacterium]